MVVFEILGNSSFFKPPKKNIDDVFDRINHYWCVLLLLIFAFFVTTSQVVGDPINCWCPAEFTGSFVDYAEASCWMRNIYYIPMEEKIPINIHDRKKAEIQYYRWVPVMLVVLAICFKVPNIMWNILNKKADINLNEIVIMANKTTLMTTAERNECIENVAHYTDRLLLHSKKRRPKVRIGGIEMKNQLSFYKTHSGKFLVSLYFFIKILYFVNCIGQFFLLDAFLNSSFRSLDFWSGNNIQSHSSRFPRTVLCDFKIRQLSNIQMWTVQCIITVNLFNERIFQIIWCLLIVVIFLNIVGLVKWVRVMFMTKSREKAIRMYLQYENELNTQKDKKLLRKFISSFLGLDGLLLLNIISSNSSDIFVADLTVSLWKKYRSRNEELYGRDETENPDHDENRGHTYV